MRILVLGAGAVGGYFGGRLLEAGGDVTFLVRSSRAEQLEQGGMIIESPFGDFKQPAAFITSVLDYTPPDVVILACKAYGLEGAMDAVAPAIGPNTVILPLLNGVAHFKQLEQRFPVTEIWGGLAHLGVTLSDDGAIEHLNNLHVMMFGARDGKQNSTAEELLKAFAPAKADVKLSDHIEQDLWDKLVFLATLAGSTCLMRTSIGSILKTTHGRNLILALLDECSAIAKAEGFAPDESQMALYRQQLTEPGSPSKASMLRDIERGAQTEVEHIIGDMVSRAARHRISAPVLKTAYTHLQAYEADRCASAP
jgi:2-dehydropantoate 2-reductase